MDRHAGLWRAHDPAQARAYRSDIGAFTRFSNGARMSASSGANRRKCPKCASQGAQDNFKRKL